ncbi:enoyl-CoA hydratase/isomerase family protein [Aerococcaceae bacterium 50-4]
MFETILFKKEDHIATITFNREASGNAFSDTTYQEVIDAVTSVEDDPDVKAIVITGAGKYFCAGGDIRQFKDLAASGEGIPESGVIKTGEMVAAVRQSSKPVIAAVNGVAAGAGLGLALACDFILMGEQSQLVTAFIQMAFPGDTNLLFNLSQAIGVYRTNRHVMLNEPITAELAATYGIAYQVVPDAKLQEAALSLAKHFVTSPSHAIAYQKAIIYDLQYPKALENNRVEAKYMRQASLSEDHREAVAAFLEKRKPQFRGK